MPIRTIYTLFLLIISSLLPLKAQIELRGKVVEKGTQTPIQGVSIYLQNKKGVGTISDAEGNFKLVLNPEIARSNATVVASMMGYDAQKTSLARTQVTQGHYWHVELKVTELNTVVVKPKKYSKKGNPAVAIIERAIAQRQHNQINRYPNYSYRTYRRTLMSVASHVDSVGGWFLGIPEDKWRTWCTPSQYFAPLSLRPLSLREKEFLTIVRNGSEPQKNIISRRFVGLEEALATGNVDLNMEELYTAIDIYAQDLSILKNRFPGPLHPLFATSYYKYYLQDTVQLAGRTTYQLKIVPFSKHSVGLMGTLWVDSTSYSIAQVALRIPQEANLNWVSQLHVDCQFTPTPIKGDTLWIPQRQEIHAMLTPTPIVPYQCEVDLTLIYDRYQTSAEAIEATQQQQKDSQQEERVKVSGAMLNTFGTMDRPEELPPIGKNTEAMMAYLQSKPSFIAYSKFVQTLAWGFLGLPLTDLKRENYYAELGPIESILSGNVMEGFRIRLGGVTNAKLNPHLFAQGYAAYGTKDQRTKGLLKLTYTPLAKVAYEDEFPQRNFSFSAQHDLFVPGYNSYGLYKDALTVLLGTITTTDRYYGTQLTTSFHADWNASWHTDLTLAYDKRTPAGTLSFYEVTPQGELNPVHRVASTTFSARLVYRSHHFGSVPHSGRHPVSLAKEGQRYPVVFGKVNWMPKGLPGNRRSVAKISGGFYARHYLSLFGFVDTALEGGFSLGKIDEVNFFTPEVNNGVIARSKTFELMQPLEYISDNYLKLVWNYHPNGLIFNRIPLLNYLGLREMLTLRTYWGHLSQRNLTRTEGEIVYPNPSRLSSNKFYIEGGIGIENIFNLLYIGYYRRFTPSVVPEAPQWCIKGGFFASF